MFAAKIQQHDPAPLLSFFASSPALAAGASVVFFAVKLLPTHPNQTKTPGLPAEPGVIIIKSSR